MQDFIRIGCGQMQCQVKRLSVEQASLLVDPCQPMEPGGSGTAIFRGTTADGGNIVVIMPAAGDCVVISCC